MALKTWGAGSAGGADGLFSTAANWTGDTVPVTTDSLIFDGTTANDCTIDALGTWSGGPVTVNTTYGGAITQNVNMVTAAFVMNGNNVAAWTMSANLTTTTFNITTGVITFGFTATTGAFQCTTFGVSSGFCDLGSVTSCLTTGAWAVSTSTGTPSVSITCPAGTWEVRGNWSHAGTVLVTFNANGGTVEWTSTGDITANVSSITFNLVKISKTSGSFDISAGTTFPLGANPVTTCGTGTITVNGTVTASGAWTHANGLIISSVGSVTGAITDLTFGGNLNINVSAPAWPSGISLHVVSGASSSTITGVGRTFGTSTIVKTVNGGVTIAASTTIPLGASPTTSVPSGFTLTVNGTVTVSGTWTHTGSITLQSTSTVSGALTDITLNESFTSVAGLTFPSGTVTFTWTGTATATLTSPGITWAQVVINRTFSASTTTIANGSTVPLGVDPSSTLGTTFNINGAVSWSGTWSLFSFTVTLASTAVMSGTGNVELTAVTTFSVNASTTWAATLGVIWNVTEVNSRIFGGGGKTFALFRRIGSSNGQISITGNNTFTALEDNLGLIAHTLAFPAGTTTVGTFAVAGSATKLVTISGTSTLTTTGGDVTGVDYISVSNSTVDVSPAWYAGANSTDGGGNTNWIFGAPPSANLLRKTSQVIF